MKSHKKVVQKQSRTSVQIRKAIQKSQDSIRVLASRYGVNPKTIAKWRARESVDDRRAGRRSAGVSVLGFEQEAAVVACRLHLRLPLDACQQALKHSMPELSRSSLHRCLQRYGLSRLPAPSAADESSGAVCFELSCTQLRQHRMIVAIERHSRYAHAELYESKRTRIAADFISALVRSLPCSIDSLVIDGEDGIARADLFRDASLQRVCAAHGIALRVIRPKQSWAPEQLGHGARLIDQAIAARGLRGPKLRSLLLEWLAHYNSHCPLDLLEGRTPAQAIGRGPMSRTMDYRNSKSKGLQRGQKLTVSRRRHRVPDPSNTREAILQAARKCLAHDGPEGLSLAEVARMAGVNRGTAYQHFETRDKLIEATAAGVSERLFQAVFGAIGATSERKAGAVDIAALTDRLAGFAMGNPELCRAWLLKVLSSPEPASDLFWREYRSSAERFDRTEFSQGGVDTEVLSVIMLAGTFLWPVWAHAQYKGKQDLGAQAQRFAEESLRISMYGNLNPERYPQIARRLAERRGIRSVKRMPKT